METVKWGYSISCNHEDCEHKLEEWSTGNMPGLPRSRREGSSMENGWYWQNRVGNYGKNRRAYCPEHSHAVHTWRAEFKLWKARKDAIGRKTWIDNLPKWGQATLKLMGATISQSVKEWESENPRPLPPWEATPVKLKSSIKDLVL